MSRSVTEPELKLQREGAAAISHSGVVMIITSGPKPAHCPVFPRIGGNRGAERRRGLGGIEGGGSARRFADRLVEAPRSFARSTSISGAIGFSVTQLERAPFISESPAGNPEKYHQDNIIGGSRAFTAVAEGHESSGRALTKKLIREIAGSPRYRLSDSPG